MSGSPFERSGGLLSYAKYRSGDQKAKPDALIFVKSIDRLDHNYEKLLEQWKLPQAKGGQQRTEETNRADDECKE